MEMENWGDDPKYCYPHSSVLKNRLNLHNEEELGRAERDITSGKLAWLQKSPIRGDLDMKHLQKMHKYIFGEVYAWAGKIRTVDIAKGNLFCKSQFIGDMAEDVFGKLKGENFLIGCSEDRMAGRLAWYTGEINALHPFREGNGRSQREFIRCTAAVAGYTIDYGKISSEKLLQASIETFDLRYEDLEQLLKQSMTRMTCEEQLRQARSIALKTGPLAEALDEYSSFIHGIAGDIQREGFRSTDSAVRRMEVLSRCAGQTVSVREAHDMLKGKIPLPSGKEEFQNALKKVGDEFAAQEKSRVMQAEAQITPDR